MGDGSFTWGSNPHPRVLLIMIMVERPLWPSSLESLWATLFIALNLFVRHALADGWVWLVTDRGFLH